MSIEELKQNLQDFLQYDSGFLMPFSYCKKRGWRALYFDELFFEDDKIDFIIDKLKESANTLEIFVATKNDIETFVSKKAEVKILKQGVHYCKSVDTKNSKDMQELFSFYPKNCVKLDSEEFYSASMAITDNGCNFIFYADEFRENFYFFAEAFF